MSGLGIVEVLVGLFLVYFVFSVMASALTEVAASLFALRANDLKKGVTMLLQGDAGAVTAFFNHPIIKALTPPGNKRFFVTNQLPSYIPAEMFARVYVSMRSELGGTAVPDKVISAFGGPNIDSALLQKQVEGWFNATMDRVTGWYKRKAKFLVIGFGAVAVIASNADTFSMVNTLWQDPTLRREVVAIAEKQEKPDISLAESSKVRDDLSSLKVLGWEKHDPKMDDPREAPSGFWNWVVKVVGLAVTTGAVSMGAPFWFDMLSKLLSFLRPSQPGSQRSAGGAGNIPPASGTNDGAALPPPMPST